MRLPSTALSIVSCTVPVLVHAWFVVSIITHYCMPA